MSVFPSGLQIGEHRAPKGTNIATITVTSANIHSGAGEGFSVLTTVKMWDKLIVLGEKGEWLNVRLENGEGGWINRKFTRR